MEAALWPPQGQADRVNGSFEARGLHWGHEQNHQVKDTQTIHDSGHPVCSELTLFPVHKIFSHGGGDDEDDLRIWCILDTSGDKKGGSSISIISLVFNHFINSALHSFIRVNLFCGGFLQNWPSLHTKGLPLVFRWSWNIEWFHREVQSRMTVFWVRQ